MTYFGILTMVNNNDQNGTYPYSYAKIISKKKGFHQKIPLKHTDKKPISSSEYKYALSAYNASKIKDLREYQYTYVKST